jgi:hypothetical protein
MIETWFTTSILDDIAAAAGVDGAALANWRDRCLADVYQDGICGGALLHLNIGEAPREVLVPLAHQSALAGIMLATEFLISAVPALRRARSHAPEGRFDVLADPAQLMARPRTRTTGCLCSDSVFLDVYSFKVQQHRESKRRRRESGTGETYE